MRRFHALCPHVICALVIACALVGCPKPASLSVAQNALDFETQGSALHLDVSNTGGGQLSWSVACGADWIAVDTASGTNNASVTVNIDRSGLSFGVHESNVVVTSSAGSATIPVRVEVEATVGSSYWPMAVGNEWHYAMPAVGPVYAKTGQMDAFSLRVVDQLEANGHEVWQVDVDVPLLRDAAIRKSLKSVSMICDIVPTSLATYWVSVDGQWYVTGSSEALDVLPALDGFVPWDEIARVPGYLLYLGMSTRLDDLGEDLDAIETALYDALDPLVPGLSAYADRVLSGDYEELFGLLAAFSDHFEGYENGNRVIASMTAVLTTLAGGVEDVEAFINEVIELSNVFSAMIEYYSWSGMLDEYIGDPENLGAVVDFLSAFSGEFSEYSNADVLVTYAVRLLAAVSGHAAYFAEKAPDYTPEDVEDVNAFLIGLLDAFEQELNEASDSLSVDAIGEDWVADIIDEVLAGVSDYVNGYPAGGAPAVADATAAAADLLGRMQTLMLDARDSDLVAFEVINVANAIEDIAAFADAYATEHETNTLAAFATDMTALLRDLATAVVGIEPWADQAIADIQELIEDLSNPRLSSYDPAHFVQWMADLEAFFAAYGEENNDVLAQAVALGASSVAEACGLLVELREELQMLPVEEQAGALSGVLPVEYTHHLASAGLTALVLADFGVGDQADCAVTAVSFSVDAGESVTSVPYMILAKDVGPMLFGIFPLQGAVINGVPVGIAK